MTFNLIYEEEEVQSLKRDLGINPANAHYLEIGLWRYRKDDKLSLECKISIFNNDGKCVQGQGANFGNALEEIRQALKPKSRELDPMDEVKVITED